MAISRPSLEIQAEQERRLEAAKRLKDKFEGTNLQLVTNVAEFNSHKLDSNDGTDSEEFENKDPAIVAADVAAQTSFLRKLKFQYLEQNAKDKYVKSVVSDIDDAPIVTAEDNKALAIINDEKKGKLKLAKERLAEVQQNIRTLAPMVEQDYQKVKIATERAAVLAQNIVDARLALTRLRQTHPQPRLTIPLADQKLVDQVTEMQTLSDEVAVVKKKVQAVKEQAKSRALEVEKLRLERAEAEKAVKMSQVEEDDSRLVPLYDWYTASLTLHQSIYNLHESFSASENELHLTYNLGTPSTAKLIKLILIFVPNARQLVTVQTSGLEELGVDVSDVIDSHVAANNVQGLVAAILARAHAAL